MVVFSGASGGLSIGYLCPEAAVGGTIALVEDGDIIHVDLNQNMIHLQISDEELEKRRANFKPLVRVAEKDY